MKMKKWFAIVAMNMRILVHKHKKKLFQTQREVKILSNIYDYTFFTEMLLQKYSIIDG